MKYTPEQVKARIREGKYNFDFEGTKRGNETRRPAEEIQNEIRNKTYQGIDYDHIAEIKRQVAKNNSYSSNKSTAQSAARKAADYNAGRANNNMSYDEKKEYLKQQKSQARKEKWRATASATLDSILGQITINEDRVKSAKTDYDTAHTQYDAAKKALEDFNRNELTAKSEELLNNNADIAQLVNEAYNAKSAAAEKTMSSGDDFTAAVLSLKGLSDGYDASSKTNEYDKAMKEIDTLLKQKNSDLTAENLMQYYTNQQNIKQSNEVSAGAEQAAKEHPVIMGTARVLTAPYSSVSNIATTVGDLATDGNYTYNGANAIQDFRRGAKSGVEQKVQDTAQEKNLPFADKDIIIGEKNYGNVYSSLYDAIDMGAENVYTSLLMGGGITGGISAKSASEKLSQAAITGAFTSSTMGEQTSQLKANGESIKDVYAKAGKDAIINFATEMLGTPLERYDGVIPTVASEALEEVIGNAVSNLDDVIRLQDEGEIKQAYDDYIAQGKSESEALSLTIKDLLADDIYAAGMAAVSSFGMAGGQSVLNNVQQSNMYRAAGEMLKNGGKVQAEIDKGLSAGTESKAYRAAQALQNSLEQSTYDNNSELPDYSSLSSRKVGRLADYNAQTESKMLDDGAKVYDGDTAKSYVYAYSDNGYNGNVADYSTGFGAVYMAQQQGKNFDEAYQSALDNGSHITPIQAIIAYEAAKGDYNAENANKGITKPVMNSEKISDTDISEKNTFSIPAIIVNNGGRTTITGVASTHNGEIIFKNDAGKTVSLNDVDFSDNTIRTMVNDAANFGTSGAAVYIKNAVGNNNVSKHYSTYLSYSEQIYRFGIVGSSWNQISNDTAFKPYFNFLGYDNAKAIYDAGVADNKALNAIRESRKRDKKSTKSTVQRTSEGKVNNETNDNGLDAVFKAVAKHLHIDVNYVSGGEENGFFDPDTATLTIVKGAKRGDATTLAHEIGEYARAYNYNAYKQYVDTVINYLFEIDAVSAEQDIMAYHRTYHADDNTTTIQDAKEELVNDVTARLFFAEGGIEQIVEHISESKKISVKEKKTFLETLKEIINKIADTIKNYVTNNGLRASEKVVGDMSLDDVRALRSQFLKVIDSAISNLENGIKIGGSTKFSYNTYPIIPLDKEQIDNANARNDIVITNDNELILKISQSLTNRKLKENYIIGAIDNSLKQKITNDIGINIFKDGQYSFVISSDDIRHIEEHFSSTNEVFDAVFKLYDTINNYDSVNLNVFQNQTELVFEKSTTKADYLALEVASKKTRSLRLKTFYVTKNNIKKAGNKIHSPANTSNSGELASQGVSLSANNSIPNQNQNVKKSLYVDIEEYFDEEFYDRFKYEDDTKITKSIEQLEKESDELWALAEKDDSYFDEFYSVKYQLKALKAGFDNVHDYVVEENKKNVRKYPSQYIPEIIKKRETKNKTQELLRDIAQAPPHKAAQFKIIQESNPAPEGSNYVWIRRPSDIKTFEETIEDNESFTWGDFTKEDAINALKRNLITVYSSYPIKQGVFVSTSYIQAQQYAGGESGKVYSKTIKPNRVAWINGDEGQYASVRNSDVKYSKDVEDIDSNSLIKQNKKLQHAVEYYKTMASRNSGHKINRKQIRQYAAELKNSWNSTMSTEDIAESLTELFDYISSGNAVWSTIEIMGKNFGKDLVESQKTEISAENKEVLDYLKQHTITIDEYQRNEIKYLYGDMCTWLNIVRRGIHYSATDGISLENAWIELSEKYPYLFDPNTVSNDQPQRLYEAIEILYDTVDNDYGYTDDELAESIMLDIYDKYFDMPEIITPIDRINKKLNQERLENKKILEDAKKADKERYEKRIQQVKEYYQDMNKRLRNSKNQAALNKLIRQKVKYENREKRTKDSREKSKLRASIRKSLNKIVQLGSNPDKKKHIPNSIVDSVKNLAEAIVLDNTKQDDKIAQKLAEFKSGFEHIPDGSQYSVISELYTDYIQEEIIALEEKTGNKPLKQLSVDELKEIDELIKMTVQSINNINRLFIKGRNETIDSYVNKVSEELKPFKKEKMFDGMTKSLMYNSMKPEYFFQYLGSDALLELYHDLRAGEDIWAVDVSDARKFAVETRKKYGYKNWDSKTVQTFNTSYGDIELTLQERLAVYANSIGEHTKNHLLGGGFVYQKVKSKGIQNLKKKRNDSSNHRLAESDVEKIVSSLDENQKAYIRDMISYLSDVMGAKGNEVTKVLYGIELFREKMYYPAKIDKKSRHNSSKEFKAEQKIKNTGFTNSVIKDASQPVELINFDDVWAAHVDEMSKYHAFVLPLENIDRVYNQYQTDNHEYSSVKEIIENAYGKKALTYIDDLISDINGGVVQEAGTDFISKATSLFKKNAVFASASVAIQQPSAIARALSEVDFKYFAKVTGSGFSRKSYNEMKQYAPVAIIKEMGYFDTNMAQSTVDFLNNNDYEGKKEKVKAFVKDGSYRDEALSFLASKADEITWTHIWNACKAEVRAKNSGLAKEEILEKTGERFTEVITKTQVYDSVFSRSGLMRSRDSAVKNATAFMAEPTTSLNMLANAVVQTKRGNISKAQGARVFGSLVAASAMNSLLQSVVTAARTDDDDKDWKEVYLAQLIPNFIDNLNPLNQIAFLKDIFNIFQGYDVTRADMNLISDLYDAIDKLSSDKISTSEKMKKLAGAISAFFGLPVKNILRDLDSVKNVKNDFSDDKKYSSESALDLFKEEMNSVLGFELFNSDLDVALKAVEKNDMETYQEYADKIYATDDAYDLLYGVLKKYGYNSSQYAAAKEKCINVKKNNGAKNPNPDNSMKGKALKEYAKLKENGTYEQAEKARQLCIKLYGDMTKVEEALKKLND